MTKLTRRDILHSGALGMAAATLARRAAAFPFDPSPATGGRGTDRPAFRLTTKEKFDAAAIPPYRGSHPGVYQHIDASLEAHIAELRRWMRQPSISAQNRGIAEMAEMLRGDLRGLGFREAEIVPTKGHPCVWGYFDAGAPKTLLVYMMYDVQPVEEEDWQSPPFEANLVDTPLGTVVMARGASNQKGPQRAFLNAVASILAVEKRLPVNLMIAAEGEEELGSVNFPEMFDRYEARMRTASGAFFPFNSQGPDGNVNLTLGVKGILYFELEAAGGPHGGPTRAEIHGSLKALVDSPVWRLVQALACLTSPDGNDILVPGYYDAIRPPSHDEQRLLNAMLDRWNDANFQRTLGVERWAGGLSGEAALLRYLADTTLNINGIWGGYTGEGGKTILPHKATAKVDSRLVPNQTPAESLNLIRRHLQARGFGDIVVRPMSGYPPAQTPLSSPLVRTVLSVYNKHERTPSLSPRLAGSAPYYLFTERLGLPMMLGGLGHGAGAHAPNEYMLLRPRAGSRIAGLAEIEKFYADMLYALAEA